MPRMKEPRKTEFVGIPLDRKTKRRLVDVAKLIGEKPTELARQGVMEIVEKSEKQLAASGR